MSIKQFNVQYFQHEDRIIFRFNTIDHSEYKFWFTRRITHYILKSAAQYFEKEFDKHVPSVASVISESQKSDNNANFNKAYESGAQYPIGSDAILVMDAKCEMLKIDDQDIFSIDFMLPGGGNLNLKLPVQVMQKMVLLLEETNMQAKWGSPVVTFH